MSTRLRNDTAMIRQKLMENVDPKYQKISCLNWSVDDICHKWFVTDSKLVLKLYSAETIFRKLTL